MGALAGVLARRNSGFVQMTMVSREPWNDFGEFEKIAEISGRPLGLASALQKLDAYSKRIPMQVSPSVAPLADSASVEKLRSDGQTATAK